MGSQQLSSPPPPQEATPPPATCLAALPYFCFTTSWRFSVLMSSSQIKKLFRDLHDFFRSDSATARAAFFIQKSEHFAQRIRVRGIPEKSSFAPHVHKSNLFQFFEMMRKSGCGNFEFVLHFSGDHAAGVRGQERAHDLEARFRAQSVER